MANKLFVSVNNLILSFVPVSLVEAYPLELPEDAMSLDLVPDLVLPTWPSDMSFDAKPDLQGDSE